MPTSVGLTVYWSPHYKPIVIAITHLSYWIFPALKTVIVWGSSFSKASVGCDIVVLHLLPSLPYPHPLPLPQPPTPVFTWWLWNFVNFICWVSWKHFKCLQTLGGLAALQCLISPNPNQTISRKINFIDIQHMSRFFQAWLLLLKKSSWNRLAGWLLIKLWNQQQTNCQFVVFRITCTFLNVAFHYWAKLHNCICPSGHF